MLHKEKIHASIPTFTPYTLEHQVKRGGKKGQVYVFAWAVLGKFGLVESQILEKNPQKFLSPYDQH